MKEKVNLITIIFALLVFGSVVFAQDGRTEAISLEEAQKLGRLSKEFPVERFREVPKGCPRGAKPYIISRNAATGVIRSENMKNFFNDFRQEVQQRFPPRGYGEKGPDRWFGDSFPLGNCKICAATLTAQVENEGADNDSLVVFLSDNTLHLVGNSTQGNRLLYLTSYGSGSQAGKPALWDSPSTPSPKTVSLDLNVNGNISSANSPLTGINTINQYIFGSPNPALEVFVQDDTKVNSMQIVIWR